MDQVENKVANKVHASEVHSSAGGSDEPDPDPGSGADERDSRMSVGKERRRCPQGTGESEADRREA